MNEQKDYLSSCAGGDNPFRMPEGYLESLEDRLLSRIAAEEQPATPARHPAWRIIKPALTLAAMFALIFGMGYGVLSLTHTLGRGVGSAAEEYASAEEELIRPVSLIDYYQADETEDTSELDEETLVNYLAAELSFADLADIYAQTYKEK
jgi:hypothetical protein